MSNFAEFMDSAEELMVKLFNSYQYLDRHKVCYIEGLPLYPSEVHVIHAIATDGSMKMAELAAVLGITKGAMTKLAAKLEDKGLIRRYQYLENRKDIYFQLTPLGMEVYEGHVRYHRNREERLYASYRNISSGEAEIILRFLGEYHKEMVVLIDEEKQKGNQK